MLYKPFVKIFIILFSILLSAIHAFAEDVTIQPQSSILYVKPHTEAYAIINLTINGNGYIYANPKGKGTGKPLVAKATTHDPIELSSTRYLPGTMHISPIDNKPVYIYKNQTSLCIPFKVKTNREGLYSFTVSIDALLCNDSSCTPITGTIAQKVKVKNDAADFPQSHIAPYKEPQQITYLEQSHNNYTFNAIDMGYSSKGILHAIIFGIIAGFILNFMPCVLPVISLKLFSFVSYAHNNPRQIKSMGFLFTLGVLTSFIILAALAAFAGYNWGELFQHKTFIILMAAIIFSMALSFFGIYTFNVPSLPSKLQSANPYIDSYFKGVLATILATPCSGPFLGAILTWTLTQHPIVIFMIFINIGIGMSLPYLILAMYPSLVRFIPKPGEWMIIFEQCMGFLLIATSIYLITLLDITALTQALWFILLLSLGLWQWGIFGNIARPLIHRIISFIILLAIVIISGLMLFTTKPSVSRIPLKQLDWDAIVHNNSSHVSMIIFTADWCPNCKLVEGTTLKSKKVIDFIKSNDIHTYKADITTKNELAEELMQSLGARSIPFVAIFPKGEYFYQPVILRDMYTSNDLLKALQKAMDISNSQQTLQLMTIPHH